jgi:ubiquinone biosynthesis protein
MGREIYPELDFWALAEPYIDNWLLEQFNPLKLKEFLVKNKDELLLKAIEIPSYIYQALDELRSYSKDKKSNEEKITKMQFQLLKEKYILRLVSMVVIIIGTIMIILSS